MLLQRIGGDEEDEEDDDKDGTRRWGKKMMLHAKNLQDRMDHGDRHERC